MSESTVAADIERAIRSYIDACNKGGEEAVAACLTPDAGALLSDRAEVAGAATIAGNFSKGVQARGLFWTVDQVAVDADRLAGVLEWSQFETSGRILRGVDWFAFEPVPIGPVKFAPIAPLPVNPTSRRRNCATSTMLGGISHGSAGLKPGSAPMRPKFAALSPAACGRTRRLRSGRAAFERAATLAGQRA